jgi:hypothetical protein
MTSHKKTFGQAYVKNVERVLKIARLEARLLADIQVLVEINNYGSFSMADYSAASR